MRAPRHLAPLLGLLACAPDPAEPVDTGQVGCASAAWAPPPACGTGPVARGALIDGPADPAFDEALAAKAQRHERLFHALITPGMGVSTEVAVDPGDRRLEELLEGDSWGPWEGLVTRWEKAAGAYAGVGIAADAFRYATLRDEGAACEEVDRARDHLLRGLEGLHRAHAITGVPGVVARGYARSDALGYGSLVEVVPLFDEAGAPLPAEKNNGTWRADASGGAFPGYVWEDSCSRDMLIGWAFAAGAAWEAIGRDPTVPEAARAQLRADAAAVAWSLLEVRESGYDLEIRDADGRMTYHGILHEESLDRFYIEGAKNGMNAAMSMGILSALAHAAGDPALHEAVLDRTVREHDLAAIAAEGLRAIDLGLGSNFSNYNMAFQGVLLAQRYTCDDGAREVLRRAADEGLYAIPGRERQPEEQGQALYDLTAALARMGGGAWWSAPDPVDPASRGAMLASLAEYPDAPYRDVAVENCDAAEVAAGVCVAVDGTPLTPLGDAGRNDTPIAVEPVPMRIRPPSNYHWRSNPYQMNGGGDGGHVYPAVDLRLVYWLGRWATPEARDGR
jgi:hypothetical protein